MTSLNVITSVGVMLVSETGTHLQS